MWRGNMLWSHLGSTQVIYNNADDDHENADISQSGAKNAII